jgi:hypothetical protein
MKNISIIIMAAAMMVAVAACKKDKQPPANPTPLTFSSLTAQRDTLIAGEPTTVTATATGDGLTYTWTLEPNSAGDLIGSGMQITYLSGSHCVGQNTIRCTVKDTNGNSQSKTVTITVL